MEEGRKQQEELTDNLPGPLVVLVLPVQLHLVQQVEMVQHGVPGLFPRPNGLVTEGFVYEPSYTATVHSDANHDGHILGQLLGVLLGRI